MYTDILEWKSWNFLLLQQLRKEMAEHTTLQSSGKEIGGEKATFTTWDKIQEYC